MPVAMSVVWDVIKNPKKSKKLAELLLKFDEVLGFDLKNYNKSKQELPQEILNLIDQRKTARQNKDWPKSDELRDLIKSKGYEVNDTKDGMEVYKI